MEQNKGFLSDEGWFRHTLDNMLEGIQIHDFSWRYTYVNDSLVKYSTYSREELIGYTLMEKYPGIEQTELFRVLNKCMSQRIAQLMETEFEFPDKTKAFFELSIQPVPHGIFILSINITERKRAENFLQLAEDSYREIFNCSTESIYVFETGNWNLTDVNKKATEVSGYSQDEMLAENSKVFQKWGTEYGNEEFQKYLINSVEVGNQLFEWEGQRKDGSLIWYEVNLKNATLAGKKRILGYFRDISDKKADEEKIKKLNEELEIKVAERTGQLENHILRLKESEERFSKAFQSSAAGMAITRLSDSKFLDVNETFANMIGYAKEEMIGRSSTELGMILDIEGREKILQEIKDKGFAKHFEISFQHKSGKITHVLNSVETIWLNGERYAISIAFDITERKLTEEKLRKSDALFSTLFESNPVSLAISKVKDGVILNVNESFLYLFGYAGKEEVIGKRSSELGLILDPEVRNEIVRKLLQDKKVLHTEGNIKTKKDEIKWVSSSIIMTELDDEPCLLAVVLDIDERKKAKDQLESVNQELEAFTYSVSHDLRAPLRSINGYAQILQEDYSSQLDEDGKRFIEIIKSNALKMGTLIDDLLNFSRLGRKELKKSEIDVAGLCNAIWQEISKDTKHLTEFKIDELHKVNADYNLLYQVIFNLISNAIKYSSKKENPIIEITSREIDNEVIFSIKDNGAGFDMLYADKLFGVFQRLHSEKEFEGTGVGLAIVKRIIVKHNGRVWAEGVEGKGATFYFSLMKD